MNNITFYSPEGKSNLSAAAVCILATVLSGAVLGFLYGLATVYIPLIYIICLATFFSALIIGWVGSTVAKMVVLQNAALLALAALLGGITSVYFSWVSWVFFISETELFTLNPLTILSICQEVAIEGSWSIKSTTPKGWGLYAFWLAEAGILLVAPFFAIFSHLNTPYCTPCKKWLENSLKISLLQPISDAPTFLNTIQSQGVQTLQNLEKSTDLNNYTELEIIDCPCCSNNSFARVNTVNITHDKKGEPSKSESAIVDLFHISQEESSALKQQYASHIGGKLG